MVSGGARYGHAFLKVAVRCICDAGLFLQARSRSTKRPRGQVKRAANAVRGLDHKHGCATGSRKQSCR